MKYGLANKLKTKDEAYDFTSVINELRSYYFQDNDQFHKELERKMSVEMSNGVKDAFTRSGLNAKAFLDDLYGELMSIKIIKLTLAYKPTDEETARINAWLSENRGEITLIDILYKKDIIGGAIIESQGKIGDYTLSRMLKSAIRKNLNVKRLSNG